MDRRTFLHLSALTPAAGLAQSARPAAGAAAKPNVIIVLTDDQGYGDLSCHGNPVLKTPHLDRLHAQSVRLTDFHAMPMCTPTRSQLMSGRDCLANAAMNVSSGRTLLRADLPTMADLFSAAGYATGVFGKWHLGDNYPYRPNDRGFQEAVWFPSSHIGSAGDAWGNDYFNDAYRHNGRVEKYEGYCTDVFFGEAKKWIGRQAQAGQPFFAYIPLNAPHGPLFVEDKYKKLYAGQPPNVAAFFGMIANIDDNMGALDRMLEERGLRENTIVVFMTDNGATAGVNVHNSGMRGRKIGLWEGGHRVPFFVRWPKGGLSGGRDIAELTTVQDVLPTLIDLCGLPAPAGLKLDGVSLAGLLTGKTAALPDRTLVIQFSRMAVGRPQMGDAAVLWKRWRLLPGGELYDLAADPAQQVNVAARHPEIAARLRDYYENWWRAVEPRLDTFEPISVGSPRENPTMLSPTEWADAFLDQGTQVRAGLKQNGPWHIQIEREGEYEITLRRWPRGVDAPMRGMVPEHVGEIGRYPAGRPMPIASAELMVAGRMQAKPVRAEDREAVFTAPLVEGRNILQTWFRDEAGAELSGAYFVYVERKERPAARAAVPVIFDTDIMGDVDDVGAVAMLHALERRGEAKILAMGVCAKHPDSPLCLDALNQYFKRGDLPLGVNHGDGFKRDTRYVDKIAAEFPHRLKAAADAPDAPALYRRILAAQPDQSVVMISVGQLSNMSRLLASAPDDASRLDGRELVRRKVKAWVCMGGKFPYGPEANIRNHTAAAQAAIAGWPGRIVLSGWEVGQYVLTGGELTKLPASSPVRRAYELYNGVKPHKSWDQTAVLYGVRYLDRPDRECPWSTIAGTCEVEGNGATRWHPSPRGPHEYLVPHWAPERVAREIEDLMLAQA